MLTLRYANVFSHTKKICIQSFNRMMCESKIVKTTAEFVNDNPGDLIMISKVNSYGFILSNNMQVYGSVIMFPRTVLSWNVNKTSSITEDSLALFPLLDPKIDLLVIGLENYTDRINPKVLSFLKRNQIPYETAPTEKAVGIYNFLVGEERFVGAALIPPTVRTTKGGATQPASAFY